MARGSAGVPRKAEEIFTVALDQLTEHGYDAMTMEGVAEEAGVNKTTLYRWWRTKDELLATALRRKGLHTLDVPDTGSFREDLVVTLQRVAEVLDTPPARAAIAGIVENDRPHLAAIAQEFIRERLVGESDLIQRAKDRGEVRPDVSNADVFHPLVGALWIQILMLGQSIETGRLERMVDDALRGFGPDQARD